MESVELNHRISGICKTVLEDAAYFMVNDSDISSLHELTESEKRIFAAIDYSGPYSGVVAISAREEIAAIAAVNMEGIDDPNDITIAKKQDALGELLNMLCGNILYQLEGPQVDFKSATPRILQHDEYTSLENSGATSQAMKIALTVDEFQTEILFLRN